MTIFIPEAVADTPPCWRQPHHRLSVPDWLGLLLVKPRKPDTIRQAWVDGAETGRDQTVRLWLLEDRPIAGGPLTYIAHRQTTPAAAWAWYRDMAQTPGHRVVLKESK